MHIEEAQRRGLARTLAPPEQMRAGGESMPEPFGEPDEQLIPRALEGSKVAWEHLIRRHERRVLLMLLGQGVRIDRARDITQETWARLIAHQRAGRLERMELPGL